MAGATYGLGAQMRDQGIEFKEMFRGPTGKFRHELFGREPQWVKGSRQPIHQARGRTRPQPKTKQQTKGRAR